MATLVRFRGKALPFIPEIQVAITWVRIDMDSQRSCIECIILKDTFADRRFTVWCMTFLCQP